MISSAVIAVCILGLQSGQMQCYDTQFESRHWIDCRDSGKPAELASAHRGPGLMRIGNVVAGRFVETNRWRYAGGGWYVISWPVVQVLLVVDENEISRGGFEGGLCSEFDSGSPTTVRRLALKVVDVTRVT
jgi:hypothetical protein